MKYNNSGRSYQVDSIEYNGEIINVFGTSITDVGVGYTVYFNGDEVYFKTFDEAYNFAKDNTRDTSAEASLVESNSFKESVDIVPIIKEVFNQSAHIDKDSTFVYTLEEDEICISFMIDCIGEAGASDVETEVNGESDEDGYAYYWTSTNLIGDLEDVTILETSITATDLKELVNEVNDKLAAESKMIRLNTDDITDQSFEIDHKEYDVDSIDDYKIAYDLLSDVYATDIKWTGKVLASIDISIIDLSNNEAAEIESTTSINEANQTDNINNTDKDYFDKLVADATPIIERVFDKHSGVSDTIVGDTDWKASTIYVSSIVNCECVGTDYNDDEVDQDDPSASDIRSAQYFEDIDIVKTVLTEADVDNLIKEVNIELEKANQPIRLTERATEFEYDYGEITLDEVNSYDVEQGDDGIGSYEYWGDVGYDSRPYSYLTDVEFTGTVPVAFDIEVEILTNDKINAYGECLTEDKEDIKMVDQSELKESTNICGENDLYNNINPDKLLVTNTKDSVKNSTFRANTDAKASSKHPQTEDVIRQHKYFTFAQNYNNFNIYRPVTFVRVHKRNESPMAGPFYKDTNVKDYCAYKDNMLVAYDANIDALKSKLDRMTD